MSWKDACTWDNLVKVGTSKYLPSTPICVVPTYTSATTQLAYLIRKDIESKKTKRRSKAREALLNETRADLSLAEVKKCLRAYGQRGTKKFRLHSRELAARLHPRGARFSLVARSVLGMDMEFTVKVSRNDYIIRYSELAAAFRVVPKNEKNGETFEKVAYWGSKKRRGRRLTNNHASGEGTGRALQST